ncbi:MAG: hypothetical protein ABIR91_01190, partial [Candidatus Saccharimonadales bacterium]
AKASLGLGAAHLTALGLGKLGAGSLAKSAAKKIPGIAIGAGIGFGAMRASKGDWLGAGGEVVSGLLGGSGVGILGSVAVDAWLMKRDYERETLLNATAVKDKTLNLNLSEKVQIDPNSTNVPPDRSSMTISEMAPHEKAVMELRDLTAEQLDRVKQADLKNADYEKIQQSISDKTQNAHMRAMNTLSVAMNKPAVKAFR